MEPKKKPTGAAAPTPRHDQAKPDPRVAALEAKVGELTEQLKKFTELAARSQADLQNAKMRMAKDAEELRMFASEMLIGKLLPTIDNFQRAFQHLPEDLKNHEWIKGIVAIEQDLLKRLTEMGLQKIEAEGVRVNPKYHEVLMTGPGEEGKILEVFEDGWQLHGKVLRPAKVKVGSASAPSR